MSCEYIDEDILSNLTTDLTTQEDTDNESDEEEDNIPDLTTPDTTIPDVEEPEVEVIKPSITNDADLNSYELVWSDEFNYIGAPDDTKWGYDIGTGSWGWGNNELQYYTSNSNNVYVNDGNLTITAIKESYQKMNYTSTRLVSKDKYDFTYGYVEISAKLQDLGGTWSAFWMLPTDNIYGGWPYSGEIDIMEYLGNDPTKILGTLHTTHYNWYNGSLGNAVGSSISFDEKIIVDSYMTYGLKWTEDSISIYCNDILYFTSTRNSQYIGTSEADESWPFDVDFHLIFNIAVGGTLGGDVPSDFTSTSMSIDYVRVFQDKSE